MKNFLKIQNLKVLMLTSISLGNLINPDNTFPQYQLSWVIHCKAPSPSMYYT